MNFLAKLLGWGKQASRQRSFLTGEDREQIRDRWEKIGQLEEVGKPSAWREAVIEADKLVDFALAKIYPGEEKTANRLVQAKEVFASYKQEYENLWYAHKIRNEMVHTVGFELPSVEAKNILEYFKRSLEILGVL